MKSWKCYLRLVLCKVPSLRSRVEELQASFLWRRLCEADSDVVIVRHHGTASLQNRQPQKTARFQVRQFL